MSSDVPCIACGALMAEHFVSMFDDRYGYPGYFSLFRCPACFQMQTVPLLSDAELPALYANYYPRRQIDVDALVRQVGEPSVINARIKRWWSGTDNQGHYATKPGTRVLDYGCGAGLSLLELRKLGADGYGLEADPNVRQVADALKLRIHIGSIDDDPYPGVRFDLIVLNQVLEHVPQPDRLLAKLATRLKSGGCVALSFPNSASFYARRFGRDWINWHVPYHLHHFHPRSTRLFLARHGWRVLSMRTITPNLWTVLQLRAPVERTSIGVPNPLWTGEPARARNCEPKRTPSRRELALQRFALRANRRTPRLLLAAFNRTLDALQLGDSILVTIAPQARA
jgi:2-polyprenyl-3-methyl-5-hydroxy-6-metoxy-1,4-benzoquinol methylase